MTDYSTPCLELKKLADMLDRAGIPYEWVNDEWDSVFDGHVAIFRIHSLDWVEGAGFSAIWGFGTHGDAQGLIELWLRSRKEPDGWLTAKEAFRMIEAER